MSAAAEEAALFALAPVAPDLTRRYGPHPSQVIDVYLPSGPERGRVTVLHGGYWREAYDRAHLTPLAAALAGEGWAVALVEYRRVGTVGGGWPGTFDDIAQAVEAASEGREQPGPVSYAPPGPRRQTPRSDPTRHRKQALLLGHSAGGQLALWAASRGRLPRRSRWWTPTAWAHGVVAVAPVADLGEAHRLGLGDGAVAGLLGANDAERAARLAQTDPMRLAPATVPTLILHGTADPDVPVELSLRYAAASGARVRELPGTGHFAPVTPGTVAFAELTAALREVLPCTA